MNILKKLYSLVKDSDIEIEEFAKFLGERVSETTQQNVTTYRANATLIAANHDCPFKDMCVHKMGSCPGCRQLSHSYWCDWAKCYENLEAFDKLIAERHKDDKYYNN